MVILDYNELDLMCFFCMIVQKIDENIIVSQPFLRYIAKDLHGTSNYKKYTVTTNSIGKLSK